MIVEDYHCYQLSTELYQIFFPEIALQMCVIEDHIKFFRSGWGRSVTKYMFASCTGHVTLIAALVSKLSCLRCCSSVLNCLMFMMSVIVMSKWSAGFHIVTMLAYSFFSS